MNASVDKGELDQLRYLLGQLAVEHLEDEDPDLRALALAAMRRVHDQQGLDLDEPAYRFDVKDQATVVLTGTTTRCTRCQASFPTRLRRMGNGEVRCQTRCQNCRKT